MTIIRDHAALSDSWSVTHPNTEVRLSNTVATPQQAVAEFGVTADSPMNSYSAGKPLDKHARKFQGKRLDYIFYRQPSRRHIAGSQNHPIIKCRQCRVVFTEKVPRYSFSFSDHFGLEAIFEIQSNDEENIPVLDETTRYGVESGHTLQNDLGISSDSITTFIDALAACYRFSRHRAHRELTVFALCVVLLLGLTVGSAWLPNSSFNPIFMLLAVFIAWLGTTMFYEGFLYGHWECNALMNVIEELEVLKRSTEIHVGGL